MMTTKTSSNDPPQPVEETEDQSNNADTEFLSATHLGSDLRAIRKSKKLTLSDVAGKIGRSVGFMSQVERGISELPVSDLQKVAALFDVPVSMFLTSKAANPEERGYIVRSESRRRIGASEGGLAEELLSPDLGGSFEIVLSMFDPGSSSSGVLHRDIEEAGYIVSGTFEVWIGGQRFLLEAGDSFRFDDEDFEWRNPGDEIAQVIWVFSPPAY